MNEKQSEIEYIKRAHEHAPAVRGNKEIAGYETTCGNWVCTDCAGSIMARGCRVPIANTVWVDQVKEPRRCDCCGKGGAE